VELFVPPSAEFSPPPGYGGVKLVSSFDELVSTPFAGALNALCLRRELPGDFREVARSIPASSGITTVEIGDLRDLQLSENGRIARDILIRDLEMLANFDLSPNLDCIYDAPRDIRGGPIATDVYSWHADSATVPADTYLCSYAGAPSEGLRNDEAIRRVDLPEMRAQLLALYGGTDDEGFADFLEENCYDLHYAALPSAGPFSFGLFNLWRIATQYPGAPVVPCVHRAPTPPASALPRLLLMS
jgi:hypothetical protein